MGLGLGFGLGSPPGDSVHTTCSITASQMARQSAWSGTDIASSSSLSAGYLARGIFEISSHGRLLALPPPLTATSSRVSNMKADQAAHLARLRVRVRVRVGVRVRVRVRVV